MTMNKEQRELCDKLATHLGLAKSTVRDLMENGWTYHAKMHEPATFFDPSYRLGPPISQDLGSVVQV